MNQEIRNKLRILIVDDELVNLTLMGQILNSEGYENLVLIQDSRDVIKHYKEKQTDLVLLDINMPFLDGYQVMEQLKAINDPVPAPVIVLTGLSTHEYLLKALTAGARDFVTKPFDFNELLMRVGNMLDVQIANQFIYDQKVLLEEMVVKRTEDLKNTQLEIVQRLGSAAEYRDEETGNHILRMSEISKLLAISIGWSRNETELIHNASRMHDIGKMGIPDAILLKPGKLDSHEWEIMKSHVTVGAKLLEGSSSKLIQMAHEIALTHHEKWDGTGYPYGLEGDIIPLVGRIAALADVFDALTSERPYKKAWTVEDAVKLIKENRGKHFDPELVDVFLKELPNIVEIMKKFSE